MTRVVKLRTRLRPDASGVIGTARTDRRTPALLARLSAGDVAVLDQVDLDGPTADAIVEAGVVAVLNRSEMISGRFPNRGPQILVDAGIAMVDQLGATGGRDPLSVIGDGQRVRVLGGSVLVGDEVVAEGREVTADDVAAQLGAAQGGLATASCRPSPTAVRSSCAARRRCCCTARGCRACAPGSRAAPSSSWAGARTTRPSCAACVATCVRCTPS